MSAPKRKKIVFVCTGNTCRSPMAEILLKEKLTALGLKGFAVSSAGIQAKKGDVMNAKSRQVLEENGIEVGEFTSTKLTEKTVCEAFAIVCMTSSQRDYLMDLRWNALKKAGQEAEENNVYSFADVAGYEVMDPYGKDIDCYRYVYGLLFAGVTTLVEKLDLRAHAYVPKPRAPRKTTASGEKKGTASKKRGRPKKAPDGESAPKKRGRPKKESGETSAKNKK